MYFLYYCQRRAGEVASGLALEVLSEEMESLTPTCPKRDLFRAAVEKVNARVWKQSDGRPGHAPRPAERKADVSSLGLHECDSTLRRRLSNACDRQAKGTVSGARTRERVIRVEGFDVHVTDAGRYIMTSVDGKAVPVTVEEYKERPAAKLVSEAPTLEEFRKRWIVPTDRREFFGKLPDGG